MVSRLGKREAVTMCSTAANSQQGCRCRWRPFTTSSWTPAQLGMAVPQPRPAVPKRPLAIPAQAHRQVPCRSRMQPLYREATAHQTGRAYRPNTAAVIPNPRLCVARGIATTSTATTNAWPTRRPNTLTQCSALKHKPSLGAMIAAIVAISW